MNTNYNLILDTDSYKQSHFRMYRPGITNVYSYIESRGGRYKETVFFGLQMYLKKYLSTPITQANINDAESFCKAHGEPFNKEGWEYILQEYRGYLPLEIRALPEGVVVPTLNPLVTVTATDPKCFWLVSFIETSLLRAIWYATTVATVSWHNKQIIKKYLKDTADTLDSLPFGLLDFSARGCTSYESNAIGGIGHLISFLGTDSIGAVVQAKQYYNCDMAGFSVPATEHSVQCSWGKENEFESFKHFIRVNKEFPIVSVVSDTWDIFKACDMWCQLADEIKASNKTLVVRPDGGDASEVLPIIYHKLERGFGTTINKKGYKVFNNVKVLWGDGIESETISPILEVVKALGFSTETILLGSGGGLLQKVNRDTCKFAMKASAVELDGKWIPISKSPITSPDKKSKAGRVMTYKDNEGNFCPGEIVEIGKAAHGMKDELITIWKNGGLVVDWTLEEIRKHTK